MLCVYLTMIGIWKAISYCRQRRRPKDGLPKEIDVEKDVEQIEDKPKEKKCCGKHLIFGIVQLVLIFGTMSFFLYMVNDRTEPFCGDLKIPQKWKCQFNYFFNTNNEEPVKHHFNCPFVTNKSFEENLAIVHGYATDMATEVSNVLKVKPSHSPLLTVFKDNINNQTESNSTHPLTNKRKYLKKYVDNEVKNFLHIIHKVGVVMHVGGKAKVEQPQSSAPAIVTAMSDRNIREGKEFVSNVVGKLHPLQDIQKLVIYDFGLSNENIEFFRQRCTFCDIRKFPFDKFQNIAIHFALKPLMIELALKEFGTVIWADPYIRFLPIYLRNIVKSAQKYGIQVAKNTEKVRITKQTVRDKVVKYLKEDSCMDSFDEIQSKFLVFNQATSVNDIVLPWIRASVGFGGSLKADKEIKSISIYNPVEETILDIIVNRLYNKHMDKIQMNLKDYVYIGQHNIHRRHQ